MLPLFDENPTKRTPIVTWLLIGTCVALSLAAQLGVGVNRVELGTEDVGRQVGDELQFPLQWAAIPCEIVQRRPLTTAEISATYFDAGDQTSCDPSDDGPALFPDKRVLVAIVSSMFLHASWFHLALNMLYLWVFGNNVEDRLGHVGFAAYYLTAGIVGTVAYVAAQPDGTVAILGASGAVAGVMGSYLVWYPDAPIRTLLFLIVVDIRSRWFLGSWFAIQFFTWTGPGAWIAHVAGFGFGVIAGLIVRKIQPRLLGPRFGQRPPIWDRTGGAGHGPYPHLDEVWDEPHHERYE